MCSLLTVSERERERERESERERERERERGKAGRSTEDSCLSFILTADSARCSACPAREHQVRHFLSLCLFVFIVCARLLCALAHSPMRGSLSAVR